MAASVGAGTPTPTATPRAAAPATAAAPAPVTPLPHAAPLPGAGGGDGYAEHAYHPGSGAYAGGAGATAADAASAAAAAAAAAEYEAYQYMQQWYAAGGGDVAAPDGYATGGAAPDAPYPYAYYTGGDAGGGYSDAYGGYAGAAVYDDGSGAYYGADSAGAVAPYMAAAQHAAYMEWHHQAAAEAQYAAYAAHAAAASSAELEGSAAVHHAATPPVFAAAPSTTTEPPPSSPVPPPPPPPAQPASVAAPAATPRAPTGAAKGSEVRPAASGNTLRAAAVSARHVSLGDGWVAPRRAVAQALQRRLHPSRAAAGGGDSSRNATAPALEPLPLCTRTGRYCPTVCAPCDPCCEGTTSQLAPYGSGVTSYFKLLKALAFAFAVLAAVAAPALVINAANSAADADLASVLAATTVSSLVHSGNATDAIALPLLRRSLRRSAVATLYAYLDLLGALFVAAFIAWLWWHERDEVTQVKRETLAVEDYAVAVDGLAPSATEAEIRAHFEHVAAAATSGGQRGGAAPATTTGARAAGAVAAVQVVKNDSGLVATFITRGRLYKRLERVSERIAFLRHALATPAAAGSAPPCCGRQERALRALVRTRNALLVEANQLSTAAAAAGAGAETVGAYVTFEYAATRDAVLAAYASHSTMRYLCQGRALRLDGRRLVVTAAPPPSAILWANLNVGRCGQRARRAATAACVLALIAGSFALLFYTSFKQQEYATATSSAACTSPAIAAALGDGSLNASSVTALAADDARARCFCATQPFATQSTAQLEASPLRDACAFQVCPLLLSLDPTRVPALPACLSWLRSRTITTLLIAAASACIAVVNASMARVMKLLTSLEAHHSVDALYASLSQRLFFAMFANTALLLLLVNAPLQALLPASIGSGTKYDDFNSGWYAHVGVSLQLAMVINAVTPHALPLASYAAWRCRQRRSDATLTQIDLNERFIGPPADYALRSAATLNGVFVCYAFSAGMPLMNAIALLSLAVAYGVDKLLFLRYYRRPPAYSNAPLRRLTALLPAALLLHLAFAVWMFSTTTLFSDTALDPLHLSATVSGLVTAAAADSGAAMGRTILARATESQVLPLALALLATAALVVVHLAVAAAGAAASRLFDVVTCGRCARAGDALEGSRADGTSYTAATTAHGARRRFVGIATYSMLDNPAIQDAFAISTAFSAGHTSLASVAQYKYALGRGTAGSVPRLAVESRSSAVRVATPPATAVGASGLRAPSQRVEVGVPVPVRRAGAAAHAAAPADPDAAAMARLAAQQRGCAAGLAALAGSAAPEPASAAVRYGGRAVGRGGVTAASSVAPTTGGGTGTSVWFNNPRASSAMA